MSRLGFRVDEAAELADYLRTLKEVRPVLVMSHLAASDTPALDDFTHEQARRFHEATESMKAVFPDLKTSLTNPPGLSPCWPSYVGDLNRPGVTLYGGNPLHGTDRAKLGMGLLPVMEMAAPVLSVHPVVKGATVSYGCLYTAPKDIRVAVVGAGYADGYPRSPSMRGVGPDPGTARPYPWAGVYADVHRRRDRYPGRRTRRYGLSAGGLGPAGHPARGTCRMVGDHFL